MFPDSNATLADRRDAPHHRMIFPNAAAIPTLLKRLASIVLSLLVTPSDHGRAGFSPLPRIRHRRCVLSK